MNSAAPISPDENVSSAQEPARYMPKIYGMALFISLLTVISVIAVFLFANKELERDTLRWQDKLNLIADSRVAAVSQWVQDNFKALDEMAQNASLQLYLTELQTASGTPAESGDPAQVTYLRNMLTATAERMEFESSDAKVAEEIKANVQTLGTGGIAIIDNTGKTLVRTKSMPPIEGALAERITAVPRGVPTLLDFQQTAGGVVQLGFVVPVYAIQSDMEGSEQIGAIVGLKPVADSFYNLLRHPGVTEKTLSAFLVRQEKDNVLYLSPLDDKTPALSKRLSADPAYLDAAFTINNPGEYSLKRDYLGHDVLVTGRKVPLTPWTLAVKIDRKEALADSDKRRSSLVTIFLLVIACVIITIIAVWRHASSKKAFELSVRTQRLAAQTAAQERLLRLVSDNQPEPIFIVDSDHRYRFANQKATDKVDLPAHEMMGKTLESIMGPGIAKDYLQANKVALATQKPHTYIMRNEMGEQPRIMRFEHIPLAHIPLETLPEPTPGVLVIEQDITEAVSERERRLRILNQLIETLIKMVDQRDPYASYHSAYVARVARAIAEEMGLPASIVETTEIAGKLMNIGKIVIPQEVLTKSKSLDDKEIRSIRESLVASADLLKHIDFDGPVVETLRQSLEHWDGTGPLKLKGDKILVSAQIVGVANAFIGMISQRSYRAAINVDEAVKMLLDGIDKKFDRKVVIALVNYLDNKGGRKELDKLTETPQKKVGT